jgi:hypothetical protein
MYYTYNKAKGTNNYVILEEKLDAALGIIVTDVNIYTYASTEEEAITIVNRKNAEESN